MELNILVLGWANNAWAFPNTLMKQLQSLTALQTPNYRDKHDRDRPIPDTVSSPGFKKIFSLSFTSTVKY